MEWHDSYCIGIEKIDSQHEKLFLLVSDLQASLTSDSMNKKFGDALKFLVEYAQTHFAEEEELMRAMDFPEYENHKKLHGKLIQEVVDILLGLKKGKTINFYHLIDFLMDWLLNHIKYEDQKIGRFFLEQTEG